MKTFLSIERSEQTQKQAQFTGEGAYHGSSNKEPELTNIAPQPHQFERVEHHFSNTFDIVAQLPVPTQAQIQADKVTFVWAQWEEALREAGELTRSVLEAMQPHLRGDKRYIYVDSKIQFFRQGYLPVDSRLWHVDGTRTLRGEQARALGYTLLHDLLAKKREGVEEHYLAYQSSTHCATEFLAEPLHLLLPTHIASFAPFDAAVQAANAPAVAQPAASVVHFTDDTIHRAVPASGEGWRLWLRVLETDREIKVSNNVVECYGTVFV